MNSAFVTAKDILINYDFSNPDNNRDSKLSKRRAAHEFQAYAYKLASDLNDLANLKIYLRLARSIDRVILERVYSFVADITEENKGPLYLWKLKQVRQELDRKKTMINFDYKNVLTKMRRLRNANAEQLLKKNDDIQSNHLLQLAGLMSVQTTNARALILGSGCSILPMVLASKKYKVTIIDYANKLNQLSKVKCNKLASFTTKDFLLNTFKPVHFNLMLVNKYWPLIPLEKEANYLDAFFKILKPDSRLILEFKTAEKSSQSWICFMQNGKEQMYFEKKNNKDELLQKLEGFRFKLESEFDSSSYSYITLIRQ